LTDEMPIKSRYGSTRPARSGKSDGVTDRIDLAHTAPFRIGTLDVRPDLRQVTTHDGLREVVEPRVMQVLVALARAEGGVVSRDDLIRCCWDGRIVGEDAINRVMSRLRRLADGIGGGAFAIETVTKVGYRLSLAATATVTEVVPTTPPVAKTDERRLNRRTIIIGTAATIAAAGGSALLLPHLLRRKGPPAGVAPFVEQAVLAIGQGTLEGNSQAIGLLRRVTQTAPDYADGWGLLALAYAGASTVRAPQFEADLRARATAASKRAFALDPVNVYAGAAMGILTPVIGRWGEIETRLRAGLANRPNQPMLISALAGVLSDVGRCRECATLVDELWPRSAPTPGSSYARVVAYWAANRLDEADRAMDEAFALFPTHFAVWFTRFYLLLYTGRADEAIGFGENVDGRPTGIPDWDFDMLLRVARAMRSRTEADVDAAIAIAVEAAHKGTGYAENSMQFAAALGRIDTAFSIAEGYFFKRSFDIGAFRFSPEQRIYSRPQARRSRMIFLPSTAAMRKDPRFARLVEELGLTRYWRESGSRPDYQSNG
jgi:DNA-binding winged helix-turn-helix (wHTH) protein/tetratricopeptide (TPR) repeat protein